jgi:LPXTG-motif cell wall-anchored protein
MYNPPVGVLGTKIAAGAGTLTVLPHTGAIGVLWLVVAAFTMVTAGMAVLQLIPRRTR